MFEKDTPLRTRVRAAVAIFVGATIILGVLVYKDRELARQRTRIAALESQVREAEAAYAAEDKVTDLVVRHACDPMYRAQLATFREQRDACLMHLRGAWVEGPAPDEDTPVHVQYVLATQALRQCWNDLDVSSGRLPSDAHLLDIEGMLVLARNDLQHCEDNLAGERKWNEPLPWNPCRGLEDKEGCLGGVQTPAPTDLQSCQGDLADSERARLECREALWAVREGMRDDMPAGPNPAIIPNTWEADTE